MHLSFCIVLQNKFGSLNNVCFLMKYQSMKLQLQPAMRASHEWFQSEDKVSSRLVSIRCLLSLSLGLCAVSHLVKVEKLQFSAFPDKQMMVGMEEVLSNHSCLSRLISICCSCDQYHDEISRWMLG